MVSFKVLAVVLLVCLITVDAKGCSENTKKNRLNQLGEELNYLLEVKKNMTSGSIDCSIYKGKPAYRHFNRKGKKWQTSCEVDAEGTAVQQSCSNFLCGIKKLESQVIQYQGNLQNAAPDATCKQLNVKGVAKGLYLLRHLEMTKEEVKNEMQKKKEEKKEKEGKGSE